MSTTLLSCGVLVINEHGQVLVGHSTGSAHWDLPKGLLEPGETPLACALREAREEFGLAFAAGSLGDLGRHAYYRGKDLHLFVVGVNSAEVQPERCTCTSFFSHYRSGESVPEMDAYTWADDGELNSRLAGSMRRLLLERGLLAQARQRLAEREGVGEPQVDCGADAGMVRGTQ